MTERLVVWSMIDAFFVLVEKRGRPVLAFVRVSNTIVSSGEPFPPACCPELGKVLILPFLDSCHHSTVDDQFFFGRTYGASGHTELHALGGRKGSIDTSCEVCHRQERLRLISMSFCPSRSTYGQSYMGVCLNQRGRFPR